MKNFGVRSMQRANTQTGLFSLQKKWQRQDSRKHIWKAMGSKEKVNRDDFSSQPIKVPEGIKWQQQVTDSKQKRKGTSTHLIGKDLKLQGARAWKDILGNYDSLLSLFLYTALKQVVGCNAPLAWLLQFLCCLDFLLVSVKYLVGKM